MPTDVFFPRLDPVTFTDRPTSFTIYRPTPITSTYITSTPTYAAVTSGGSKAHPTQT